MSEKNTQHHEETEVQDVPPKIIASEADLEAFRSQPEIHVDHVKKPENDALKTRRINQELLTTQTSEIYQEETILGLLVRGALSIAAGVIAFSIVAGIVLAIVVPPWYRNLEPRYQQVWCNRLSLLCDLKPDHPEDDVYALADNVDTSAADALLATSTPTLEATQVLIPTSTPQPTNTPMATEVSTLISTEAPTIASTPTVPPSPIPTATSIPLPSFTTLTLDNLSWEQQRWNNCGPTTITIGLTYFGYDETQRRAANFLKPNPEDTNVSPSQLVEFVNSQVGNELSVRALYRVGGTPEMLKRLVANDFPVIVERGIIVEDTGWMGHYSLVVGYDDASNDGEYLVYDSYLGYSRGAGRRFSQDSIEDGWRQFNYTFIVLYTPSREGLLREILGQHADPAYAAQFALKMARADATADADDKWAWFNIGTAYTLLGQYDEAALAFDRARQMSLEFRMMWYQFGPYIAYLHTGRYDDVLALARQSERTTPYVEEVYYYRGLAYAAQGETDSAIFQFDRTLQNNPNYTAAEEAKQAVLEGRFEVSLVN